MAIEIKINKEINNYKENIFFGLTLRQFVCSAAAVAIAVGAYFVCVPILGEEAVSWICILCAVPMGAAGFIEYNGMYLEQLLWAICKTQLLCAGKRVWRAQNYYFDAFAMVIKEEEQADRKRKKPKQKRASAVENTP